MEIERQVATFLQSLQGKQAVIVLSYLLVRRAMTIEELEAMTGLHNDTVRTAIKGLASKGLVFKQTGEHGRQVWLPKADTLFNVTQSPKISDSEFQNPKKPDSDGLNVVVIESNLPPLLYNNNNNKSQNPKKPDSEIRSALRAAGIIGRKAALLSACDWITPEYIQAHIRQAQSEGWDNPAGMAIYRMESNLPAPEVAQNELGHPQGCNCPACQALNSYRCPICREPAPLCPHTQEERIQYIKENYK